MTVKVLSLTDSAFSKDFFVILNSTCKAPSRMAIALIIALLADLLLLPALLTVMDSKKKR